MEAENRQCYVCLEEDSSQQTVWVETYPCGHIVHQACFQKMMETKVMTMFAERRYTAFKCGLCRQTIKRHFNFRGRRLNEEEKIQIIAECNETRTQRRLSTQQLTRSMAQGLQQMYEPRVYSFT